MKPWKWTALIVGGYFVFSVGGSWLRARSATVPHLPDAVMDAESGRRPGKGLQTVVLAAGCFWSTEAIFERLKGVTSAESGYSGGSAGSAHYDIVSGGGTQHAESVRVQWDPAKISFGQILKVYFSVAHDPTQLNRQGPDVGYQYRSAIFCSTDEQCRTAEAYIRQLEQAHVFRSPIVTKVQRLEAFYRAEDYHQKYVDRNPHVPYVMVNAAAKLDKLQSEFPDLIQ